MDHQDDLTPQEEIGYSPKYQHQGSGRVLTFPMTTPSLLKTGKETSTEQMQSLKGASLIYQSKKRIRYISGLCTGDQKCIRFDIADDLIQRGKAVDIDREPGEEG